MTVTARNRLGWGVVTVISTVNKLLSSLCTKENQDMKAETDRADDSITHNIDVEAVKTWDKFVRQSKKVGLSYILDARVMSVLNFYLIGRNPRRC